MNFWNVRRVGGHTPQLDNIPFLLQLRDEKKTAHGDNTLVKTWFCNCGSQNPRGLNQCLDCAGDRKESELLKSHISGLCGGATNCRFCEEEGRTTC